MLQILHGNFDSPSKPNLSQMIGFLNSTTHHRTTEY